ncbi:OsmC family protein [Fluviicola taffensis]|uniref:OsmC family protein n=1 Tax=Fluviicola taffensis (strain DSM 16823 / NCIMB 13979 / RW262) TaxID=755732 RepID=F2IIM4_FLUTR|nr:OsmC family protein [Fluviicola taffensis]AEA45986.1 OsmC family protein [Fluviicola taffensis DSM 16823]
MKLELKLTESPFVLEVKNESGISLKMDATEKIGGKNKGMRPMEVLASSLAGCMSIDILLILQKQRQIVSFYEVNIDANRKDDVPSPFETIHLVFTFNQEVDIEKANAAIQLSYEKYCSVSASLNPAINIQLEVRHQS